MCTLRYISNINTNAMHAQVSDEANKLQGHKHGCNMVYNKMFVSFRACSLLCLDQISVYSKAACQSKTITGTWMLVWRSVCLSISLPFHWAKIRASLWKTWTQYNGSQIMDTGPYVQQLYLLMIAWLLDFVNSMFYRKNFVLHSRRL